MPSALNGKDVGTAYFLMEKSDPRSQVGDIISLPFGSSRSGEGTLFPIDNRLMEERNGTVL